MSHPVLLSILIPITPDRRADVLPLYRNIAKQSGVNTLFLHESYLETRSGMSVDCAIEVVEVSDNKEMTIGEKRERLYLLANGLYSWQIDSDDSISTDSIKLILEAITQLPDCITFQEHINIDGKIEKSNHSLEYGDWEGEGSKELWDGFHYHRTPFMKSVIKTEIARSVPIPHIRFGEDHKWAQALKPHLKTEIHIPQDIYFYQHISTPFAERYGLNQ